MTGNELITHRNFTFPAYARTAVNACDGVAIRFWARFAFRQKHRFYQRLLLFPQTILFCGSPELLSAQVMTQQKYHYCVAIHLYSATPLSCVLSLSMFNERKISLHLMYKNKGFDGVYFKRKFLPSH